MVPRRLEVVGAAAQRYAAIADGRPWGVTGLGWTIVRLLAARKGAR
jgi:hypothetical protein